MKIDMSIPGIKKYYIGFAVFAVAVLGMTIFTLTLASAAKQDKQTIEKSQEIAKDLNKYISTNRRIPDDLSVLSVKDIPDTISYTKKSDAEYEFCVTYKTASSYNTPDITSAVAGPLFGGYSGGVDYYSDEEVSNYKPGTLYISSYSHKKGEDCQTIAPYISSSLYRSSSELTPSIDQVTPTLTASSDTERRADVNILSTQLETAYSKLGYYPSMKQLNDASWRQTNMPSLDKEALRAPGSSSYTVSAVPTDTSYGYLPYNDKASNNTLNCDNSSKDTYCTRFTIFYYLSTGQQIKRSVN